MLERVTLFLNPVNNDNESALAVLQKFEGLGVMLEVETATFLLAEKMTLPSILTNLGDRAHGVKAISRYAEVQPKKILFSRRPWIYRVFSKIVIIVTKHLIPTKQEAV